jgi:hypothetical protein
MAYLLYWVDYESIDFSEAEVNNQTTGIGKADR